MQKNFLSLSKVSGFQRFTKKERILLLLHLDKKDVTIEKSFGNLGNLDG
jgi:hypothetical protein